MRRRNGFTLLEILVALVVLGFLLAGLSQGVRFGLKAWGLQTRRVGEQADMDATFRAIGRMIEAADPGETNEPGSIDGNAHTLAMVTTLPVATAGFRTANVGLGVDARHRLVLRAVPDAHAERLAPMPPALVSVLAEGVDHVDFSYFSAGPKQSGWSSGWSDPALPALIKMQVVFPKGDKRHWPDLVAAPMRVREEQ